MSLFLHSTASGMERGKTSFMAVHREPAFLMANPENESSPSGLPQEEKLVESGEQVNFPQEGDHQETQSSEQDRKSTRLNSSHSQQSRMPSSA